MCQIKVGDRLNDMCFGMGSVIYVGLDGDFLVEFDDYIAGHSGGTTTGKEGHCWWFNHNKIDDITIL